MGAISFIKTTGDTSFGTTRDAAKIYGVTPGTVYKWMAAGMIAVAEKRGKAWRFDLAEIERLRDSEDSEDLIWFDRPDR